MSKHNSVKHPKCKHVIVRMYFPPHQLHLLQRRSVDFVDSLGVFTTALMHCELSAKAAIWGTCHDPSTIGHINAQQQINALAPQAVEVSDN